MPRLSFCLATCDQTQSRPFHALRHTPTLKNRSAHAVSGIRGAADVPGATRTRAASYTSISRGDLDARALRMACAERHAGMRDREGAWGCARRRFAADILRAHAGPRCGLWRGSGARAPRNGFCSTTLSRGWGRTCADGIERKAQPRRLTVRQPSGRSCFPIDTCWRPARAQCSLPAALCAPPRRPSRSGARCAPRKRT